MNSPSLYVSSLSFLSVPFLLLLSLSSPLAVGVLVRKKLDIHPVDVNVYSCGYFCHHFYLQEFSDPRDADDARYSLNGRDVDGSRITVEFAKGVS